MLKKYIIILYVLITCLCGTEYAYGQNVVKGRVLDINKQPLQFAAVVVSGMPNVYDVTDSDGCFILDFKKRSFMGKRIEISLMGYITINSLVENNRVYILKEDVYSIKEVVVTATESHEVVNSSRIGKSAIKHIQPSSIADVMELLPGGRAKDPILSSPQIVSLRSAATISGGDYSTHALGTKFLIDGIPVNNDANLQSTPAYSAYGSSFVNAGADMRTISTDDIESIEVVRGIPSVEYGDLTSGLVSVKRKQGGRDIEARFKADMQSKLFYTGKGFEWGERDKLTMNVNAGYLNAMSDPRNTRQNYSRLTAGYRIGKRWTVLDGLEFSVNGNMDFTGSFDNRKSDKDLDRGLGSRPIEIYKSEYNKIVVGAVFGVKNRVETGFFRQFMLTTSLTAEFDEISRWKYVVLGSTVPLSTALTEGEHDALIVPSRYEATLKVDGKPFYAYVKALSKFRVKTPSMTHDFKIGTDWNMDKNYGKGVIFDPHHPFSPDMNVRPRRFSSIPAIHHISAFAEVSSKWNIGVFRLETMLGIRATSMINIEKEYSIQGSIYTDPRLNVRLEFPAINIGGSKLVAALSGGVGWHTKMPTMDMLYPDPIYYDITQFNYWPVDKNLRRINLFVKRYDPTNHKLKAARNFKREIRGDAKWNGLALSITYFREDMQSGFRSSSKLDRIIYKDYDESAVDYKSLTGPPSLENLPYVKDTLMLSYSFTTNGSRTQKEGVEFTLSTKRVESIKTKLTITGAWFKTRYSNSQPQYYRPSVVIGGKIYPYIGLYEDEDKYLREMFNTNFTLDTQIPRFGLIFSTSFQCLWFTGAQNGYCNPYPILYIDKNLKEHKFTEESAKNGVLAELIKSSRDKSIYEYGRIPFSMNINLKVTKTLYKDKMALAVFVNKIADYTPSYETSKGITVRRDVRPYFGMELNFKL